MSGLTIAVGVILIAGALFNLATAFMVQRMLRRPLTPLVTDDEAPLGLVVLCLRGGDEFLDRSLRRLFTQDYPRYRVRIVLDSAQDTARPYVDQVIRELEPAHVEVVTLGERFDTCTYKMSGILWGTRSLPEGTAFVALMDGDTVPHSTWLRELATPLVRDGALCSTGNRWYFPERPEFASLVRVCWGAGALIMMSLNRIPWGGTMAFRREVIADERLRDRIRHAFSEDTTIGQFVNELGGRVEVDPRLLIVNFEGTSLKGFFGFETRQLLAARLQHRAWGWIVACGTAGLPMLVYPLARIGGWRPDRLLDALFAVYFFSLATQAILFGPAVRRLLRMRDEYLPRWNARRVVLGLLAAPTAQLLHLVAIVRAITMRVVVWRGVHYRIGHNPRLLVVHDESRAAPTPETLARSA